MAGFAGTARSRLGNVPALALDEIRYRADGLAIMLRRAGRHVGTGISEMAARRDARPRIPITVREELGRSIIGILKDCDNADILGLIGEMNGGYQYLHIRGLRSEHLESVLAALVRSGRVQRDPRNGVFSLSPRPE